MANKDLENEIQKARKVARALWITIIALLLIVLFFAIYFVPNNLGLFAKRTSERYNFLNPARNFYNNKDLIVNFQPLRDYLNQFEADKNTSIYFEYLNTGANIAVTKDAEFWAASLLKVPVAMAAAKKIENGEWKWGNELVLMNSDKDADFGSLHSNPIGTKFTIEDLAEEMLVYSDNTARNILSRNLETAEVDDVYQHLGLSAFFSEEGKISAKKYSIIFRSLYNASYLSDDNSQKLLDFLSKSSNREYLGGGIDEDVKFAHKFGINEKDKALLDSGIVYLPGRPYLLTVMINYEDKEKAKNLMHEISKRAYEYVSTYNEK